MRWRRAGGGQAIQGAPALPKHAPRMPERHGWYILGCTGRSGQARR
jgi:hypothetical protein